LHWQFIKVISPELYIISLAWLGFDIALLKGLICNWLEKTCICLNACWCYRAPSGFFWGPQQPFTGIWPQQYVVTTADLMFRKLFDLWWFHKLHVEI